MTPFGACDVTHRVAVQRASCLSARDEDIPEAWRCLWKSQGQERDEARARCGSLRSRVTALQLPGVLGIEAL